MLIFVYAYISGCLYLRQRIEFRHFTFAIPKAAFQKKTASGFLNTNTHHGFFQTNTPSGFSFKNTICNSQKKNPNQILL
jgi:hypothetical protein